MRTREERTFLQQKIAEKAEHRRDALAAYGNRCACCGSKDYLEIDHIHGDGAAHRAEIFPQPIASWLKDHDYPDTFQLLCHRCNMSKRTGASCHLDHSRDMLNESQDLLGKTRKHLSKRHTQGNSIMASPEQEDGLVPLNTRINAEKKADLMKRARERGIAVGVIIDELMNDDIREVLRIIEAKLDILIQQSSSRESPPVPLPEPRHDVGVMDWPAPPLAPSAPSVVLKKRSWFRRS